MRRLVGGRLVSLLAVLFVLSLTVFAIRAVLPGDPVRAMVGATAPEAVVERVRSELGYDQPLPVQYVRFLGDATSGNLGISLRTRRPVIEDIAKFGPATLELAIWTGVLVFLLALVFGTWAASGRRGAGGVRFVMTTIASTPAFMIALILLIVLYRNLGLFPPGGRLSEGINATGPTGLNVLDGILQLDLHKSADALWHLVIPCLCLALLPAIAVGRVLHGSLTEVMSQDYVKTARSKGLSRWSVVVHHGLRNASGPAVSMAGLQFGALLTGVVIIEQIMSWPGLGRYASQAIEVDDFPAITGVVLVLGVAYVLVNLGVDLFQLFADPRLRAHELER